MRNLLYFYPRMLLAGLVAIAVLCSSLAVAGNEAVFDPSVEYSATRVISTSEGEINMRVFHTPEKERMEMASKGQRIIMITRFDRKVNWMLMPEQQMYMEMSLDEAMDRAEGMGFGQDAELRLEDGVPEGFEKLGRETINGFRTTKYRGNFEEEGQTTTAYYWITDSGIVVKMEYEGLNASGRPDTMTMELRELKIGKQPDDLFEPPAGYQKMNLNFGAGGLGGMLGGMSASERPAASSSRPAQPRAADSRPRQEEQEDSPGIVSEIGKEAGNEAKRSVSDEVKRSVRDAVKGFFR